MKRLLPFVWKPYLLFLVGWLYTAPCLGNAATPESLKRSIRFRDGTILRLRLPDTVVTFRKPLNGKISIHTARLSELSALTFTRTPRLPDLLNVTNWVAQLGHDHFGRREQAQEWLLELGSAIRVDLEAYGHSVSDLEIKARIQQILKVLPTGSGEALLDTVTQDGKTHKVDAGDWSLRVKVAGKELTLSRKTLAALSNDAPSLSLSARPAGPARTTRIKADDPNLFGPTPTRIDFQTAPDGKALSAGMDVSKTFIPKGFILETSIQGAIVSVNTYNVNGPSKGNSCATHRPLYQGQITIRFCVPGHPKVPAAVTRAGLWIAAVSPNSTALEAYDARDQRIAEIKTVKGSNDFLGLQSSVPIAYLKVVPNMAVDRDYTIDDLVFDVPKALHQFGRPKQYSLRFSTGERIFAETIEFDGKRIRMRKLSIGIEQLERPRAQLTALFTPTADQKTPRFEKGCWAKLNGGSDCWMNRKEKLSCLRIPHLKFGPQALAALWGKNVHGSEPKSWPEEKPGSVLVVKYQGGDWLRYASCSFKEEGIEIGNEKEAKRFLSYADAPTIWFKPPRKPTPDCGAVRLTTGETFVLRPESQLKTASGDLEIRFVSWENDRATFQYAGQPFFVPVAEIMSLVFPK